jgi:hypothetical protein
LFCFFFKKKKNKIRHERYKNIEIKYIISKIIRINLLFFKLQEVTYNSPNKVFSHTLDHKTRSTQLNYLLVICLFNEIFSYTLFTRYKNKN